MPNPEDRIGASTVELDRLYVGRLVHELKHLFRVLELHIADLLETRGRSPRRRSVETSRSVISSVFERIAAVLMAARDDAFPTVGRPTPIGPETLEPKRLLNVLWVDDDKLHSAHFRGALEDLGWNVTTAATVEDALALLSQRAWDGVITDLLMPPGPYAFDETGAGTRTGLVFARRIRQDFPSMPIAFVTVADDRSVRQWCAQNQPAAYVTKPQLLSETITILDSLMRHATGPTGLIEEWLTKFPLFARTLSRRYSGRPGIVILDEYDAQDLLGALLVSKYSDIRREEWTPSYAGGSARIDFVIPSIGTAVEVKLTRKALGIRKLGEELLVDVAKYKRHPSVRTLICFVLDAWGIIDNPEAFAADLRAASSSGLQVGAVILPYPSERPNALQPTP